MIAIYTYEYRKTDQSDRCYFLSKENTGVRFTEMKSNIQGVKITGEDVLSLIKKKLEVRQNYKQKHKLRRGTTWIEEKSIEDKLRNSGQNVKHKS